MTIKEILKDTAVKVELQSNDEKDLEELIMKDMSINSWYKLPYGSVVGQCDYLYIFTCRCCDNYNAYKNLHTKKIKTENDLINNGYKVITFKELKKLQDKEIL